MLMPHRSYASTANYRFGFNGKENDNEPKGLGNQQDYGMRIFDSRLGKFLSVDPLVNKYPELTPYQFGSNRPIDGIDMDGLEWANPQEAKDFKGNWNDYDPFAMKNGLLISRSKAYSQPDFTKKRFLFLASIPLTMFGGGIVGNGVYSSVVIETIASPAVITSATTFGVVGAKYGPNVINFIYGLSTGDATEPIPTNNGFESADVGSYVRSLFRSPVNISGWLKYSGAESVNLIKGSVGGKVAVIGQGMDMVRKVANGLKNALVFTPSKEALKEWDLLLSQSSGKLLSDEVVKGTKIYKENLDWITKVKKEGYDIIDAGGGETSTFYNMEKKVVYGENK